LTPQPAFDVVVENLLNGRFDLASPGLDAHPAVNANAIASGAASKTVVVAESLLYECTAGSALFLM